jgi:hypothetical protein
MLLCGVWVKWGDSAVRTRPTRPNVVQAFVDNDVLNSDFEEYARRVRYLYLGIWPSAQIQTGDVLGPEHT